MTTPFILTYPQPGKSWREQSEELLLTAMVCGEARGEGLEGMLATACVALNRLTDPRRRWGVTLHDVLLRPKQFSCFNPDDPNSRKLLDPLANGITRAEWARCLWVARGALSGMLPDNTGGANHYLTPNARDRVTWDDRMVLTAVIGGHVFLKG